MECPKYLIGVFHGLSPSRQQPRPRRSLPHYAAPEQINGRVKDERTDIWQLGVILYELVTGILPFNGDSMVEIGMNIATKDPKRPGEIIPDAKVIDAVVMKCLQKDPTKRYQSVLELQKDLALYLKENYTELLKTSVTAKDYNRSAYYCGDLVMINLLTGDIPTSRISISSISFTIRKAM